MRKEREQSLLRGPGIEIEITYNIWQQSVYFLKQVQEVQRI